MCTMISITNQVRGMGKGPDHLGDGGWFRVTKATVGYDHTTHFEDEHSLLLDFTNYDLGIDARVGLELDLASGRALVTQLQEAIRQAELSGV